MTPNPPQSDSTPWTLTLRSPLCNFMLRAFILISAHCALWNENEYLLYLQSSVYILFHHSLNSQKLQSTRLRISEIVYLYIFLRWQFQFDVLFSERPQVWIWRVYCRQHFIFSKFYLQKNCQNVGWRKCATANFGLKEGQKGFNAQFYTGIFVISLASFKSLHFALQ